MTNELAGTAFEVQGFRALALVGGTVTLAGALAAAGGLVAGAGRAAVPVALQVLLLAALAAPACSCVGYLLPVGRGRHVTDHAAEVLRWVPASRAGRYAAPYALVGVVTACGLLVLHRLGSAAPLLGWPRLQVLAGWVLAGFGLGLVLAAGPLWGLLSTALLAGGSRLLVPGAVDTLPLAVAAAVVVAGCTAHLTARSGFRATERAARAAEDARIARHQAEVRLLLRRRTDRTLHDTVLATLTVLAHAGVGVPEEEVRASCRRDLALLGATGPDAVAQAADPAADAPVADALAAGAPAAGLPLPPPAGPAAAVAAVPAARTRTSVRGQLARRLGEVRRLAARRGIDLRVHLQAGSTVDALTGAGDDPVLLQAWSGALAECVTNIARHADVDAADIVLGLTDDALVTVVVDEGVGFEPAAVGGERLGLSGSVRERLVEVGGAARVWSRPGQGTVVELTVPWPRRLPVGAGHGGAGVSA